MTAATRVLLAGAVAAMLAGSLAACAKKGAPEPPAGVPNTYPRVYPPPPPRNETEPGDDTQPLDQTQPQDQTQ